MRSLFAILLMGATIGWAFAGCSTRPTIVGAEAVTIVSDDFYTTPAGQPLIVGAPGVTGNDSGLERDSISVVLATGPASGSLTLFSTGAFMYEPIEGFTGSDSFEYVVSDGPEPVAAIVAIEVTPRSSQTAAAPAETEVPDADSSAGATLFASTCASCHGPSGEGAVGPPLAGRSLGSDEITIAVTDGPGIMPAFSDTLTPGEIGAVVDYVIALGAGTAGTPVAAPPSSPAERFAFTCASCHGPDGQGTALGPDIAGEEFDEIIETVRFGDDQMPAFSREAISDEELRALADYVAGLRSDDYDDDYDDD